jgi:hypothetical protein
MIYLVHYFLFSIHYFCSFRRDRLAYSDFNFFLHPSYFAMYLVFAQLIVMIFYPVWLSHLAYLNINIGFISFLLLFATFLCSSKMGLI